MSSHLQTQMVAEPGPDPAAGLPPGAAPTLQNPVTGIPIFNPDMGQGGASPGAMGTVTRARVGTIETFLTEKMIPSLETFWNDSKDHYAQLGNRLAALETQTQRHDAEITKTQNVVTGLNTRIQGELQDIVNKSRESIVAVGENARTDLISFQTGLMAEIADTKRALEETQSRTSEAVQVLIQQVTNAHQQLETLKTEAERVVHQLQTQLQHTQQATAQGLAHQQGMISGLQTQVSAVASASGMPQARTPHAAEHNPFYTPAATLPTSIF